MSAVLLLAAGKLVSEVPSIDRVPSDPTAPTGRGRGAASASPSYGRRSTSGEWVGLCENAERKTRLHVFTEQAFTHFSLDLGVGVFNPLLSSLYVENQSLLVHGAINFLVVVFLAGFVLTVGVT